MIDLFEQSMFYCEHISELNESDFKSFKVKHKDDANNIEIYLKQYALQDEKLGFMRTYLVFEKVSKVLVGYFSLKSGMFAKDKDPEDESYGFDTIPGIELAYFALNDNKLTNEIEDIGIQIFNEIIMPIVLGVSNYVGVGVLYVYALPIDKLIRRYQEAYGFVRLDLEDELALNKRYKPSDNESCIFMYQRVRSYIV